jgi:two-component system sensor histidine kinase AtoS
MQIADASTPESLPVRPALRDISLWFVLITLAGTTLLHYLTDIHLIPYHSIYRSLYYVPIAVAAVRYGRRGGVLTALTASALYIPHVILSWGIMLDDGVNDLLENAVFLFVGAFAGSLADAERRQRQRAQEAAQQLAAANAALQTQAAVAERMRASIASILESIDSGVLTLDTHGNVTTINRAAQALLHGPNGSTTPLPQLVRDYLASGARGYRQVAIKERQLGLHGSPLVGAHGETIGTVLVLDDLTELRALEEQIQRAQRLAALGRLAGGLAHEIRNPLGIMRAAAQMLQRELADQATLSEYAQVIQSEVDRVDRLIEQLLAYARPAPLQRGPIDIAGLIERTLTLTRAYAAQHGVALSADVDGTLPPLEGDAELLHQAIINLLLNGINATKEGGEVHMRASVQEAESARSFVVLAVHDTGRGIAADDLPHIFDPFFTTRVDGTGLGLSIVQQIVQEHQGTVDVHSTPGAGTHFIVRLPVLRRSADPVPAQAGMTPVAQS